MAYGTAQGVTLFLGEEDEINFTPENMAQAIIIGDIVVDAINSAAIDVRKIVASNIIAAEVLKEGRNSIQLKGLMSDAGNEGRPGKTRSMMKLVPEIVNTLLKTPSDKPAPKFSKRQPDSFGQI